MVDSTDHISGKTGLTTTVTISKNGAAFGAPAGAVTEIGSGWYKIAANATDSNTIGSLLVHATATGADPLMLFMKRLRRRWLKAPTLPGSLDITTAQVQTELVTYGALKPTVAARTLDVSTTGEAGVDWANVGAPATAQNLSATTISTSQVVASVSGSVGSVTGAVGSVTGAVGSVTGAVTVGTNNDKTGYALTTAERDAIAAAEWNWAGTPTAGRIGDYIKKSLPGTLAQLAGFYRGQQCPNERQFYW